MSELKAIESTSFSNSATFENLFKSYYNGLCNYAYKLLLNQDEAEDMVQQVFSKIWEKRNDLNAESSVKSYLYRATYNQCVNEMKRKEKFNSLEDENVLQKIDLTNTEEITDASELEQSIEKGLANLPEKCRAVFVLSRYEDMKYKEISEFLGIYIKTVENHMGKALKMMRIHLTEFISILYILLILK